MNVPFPGLGSYPVRDGNLLRPLVDGGPAYRRICETVRTAQFSVWLTVTFFAQDFQMPEGQGSLFDVLDRAVDRGLDVRAIFWRPNPESIGYRRRAMTDPDDDAHPASEDEDAPFDLDCRRPGAARAAGLREQAQRGGLRFEAYLPPDLGVWLLDHIARGDFADPSEAVFVMLGEQEELERYPDLRRDLLRRTIEEADNDPRPAIPADIVFAEIDAMLAAPRPPAAEWLPPASPEPR